MIFYFGCERGMVERSRGEEGVHMVGYVIRFGWGGCPTAWPTKCGEVSCVKRIAPVRACNGLVECIVGVVLGLQGKGVGLV